MAAVKALQQWCRLQCEGYRDVSITNMTTSFRDGLAFCALIHRHRPELINFDSLKKEDVYENNKLAFRVAEEELGIPALLDAEDMVALKVPDRLSILTYVSQYYNYFHGRSPIGGMGGIKRPADGPTDQPSGKKNQPVSAKVFPASKPARENSPPPASKTTRPPPSPKQNRNTKRDIPDERPQQTGTLSNKCVSCNKHVHLVQRYLVDGKLYHRNCAKSLSPTNTNAPLQDLPRNTPFTRFTSSSSESSKTSTPTPTPAPRLGPTWLKEKPKTPSTFSSSLSPPQPTSSFSSPAKDSQTAFVSKPSASQTTVSTFTTTTSVTVPSPAPQTSTTAAKTLQSKLKFFQSDNPVSNEETKTSTKNLDMNRGLNVARQDQEATVGQAVTVVVNVGGRETNTSKAANVGGDSGKVNDSSRTKAAAAAFISKKLTEENNNNNTNKPTWTTVAAKKSDKPAQVETPQKEPEWVRGRVKLRADPSILADLPTPPTAGAPNSGQSPSSRSGLTVRTPDRGGVKPRSSSPNTSASENESPADWRSRLKPVSKDTKPAASSLSSPKPWTNGAGKSQTPDPSVRPSPSPHLPNPSIAVSPPPSKGFVNGQKNSTDNGTQSKITKTKPDYIPKEDIIKELQEIEDNLNELEKRGVELEVKLRRSEEEGEDDSLMDELMVEWFNLIRNKQVAMRRESELVYVGRTQDLEEQQPTVEQELRRLMEKPEHLKTAWDRKREEQLMAKLMEIINDRNAIVEGLDEDRLREEEEDEQLNKMMMNFNIKKEPKPKKKSPMSKLFNWGNKKEG
ncbi:MICAL-like protein 2 [Sphaeramia orbicularis]|uniref:MICAL-like protein 2 n=1 Tax=Sphaeramia orbicularis TaxID=375764 RepID=A0A672ZU84_9TELE|nr:MICAL-like protein 2 [Sphaeramia orbicularis]